MNDDRRLPIAEHLEELRRRILNSLVATALGTALAWGVSGRLMSWLAAPVGGLVFLAPTEAFFGRLKIAMYGGLLLSLPYVLLQIWLFIACALGEDLKRALKTVIPLSYALFLAGVALCVYGVVPSAMRFLMAYGSDSVRPLLALGAYLEFVTTLSLAFGVVFQLPLVLILLNRAGVVERSSLTGRRRYVYLGAFVAAAMLTPGPDIISQLALAVPMAVLFELSLLFMRRT